MWANCDNPSDIDEYNECKNLNYVWKEYDNTPNSQLCVINSKFWNWCQEWFLLPSTHVTLVTLSETIAKPIIITVMAEELLPEMATEFLIAKYWTKFNNMVNKIYSFEMVNNIWKKMIWQFQFYYENWKRKIEILNQKFYDSMWSHKGLIPDTVRVKSWH